MHPEIEKLIDLALADGQITEKERNVILKKAAELGVDADEVEMTLDGKLHQLEASKTKQKEKVGNIKTCPACGASAKAMELVCSECSHEFTNTKANSTLLKLLEEIEKINNKEILSPQILKGAVGDLAQKNTIDMERNKLKSELIENFPIPNSREEFLIRHFHTKTISQSREVKTIRISHHNSFKTIISSHNIFFFCLFVLLTYYSIIISEFLFAFALLY